MSPAVLWGVVILFPVFEIALGWIKRADTRTSQLEDRGSLRLLWIAIIVGDVLAVAVQGVSSARLPGSTELYRLVGSGLILAGLALRVVSILTLGRFFTVDVAIHSDHSVVEKGPYRFVRHPSYSGLLLAFIGLGVFLHSWLSILVLLVFVVPAVVNRVAKEESALVSFLGPPYVAYCARTKRFIPWVI
jgi:protein-S-isoprenylcysteine O-methyltransferase